MSNAARAKLRVVEREDAQKSRPEPEELNLRVLQALFRYIRTHHGDDTLKRIIEDAGLDPALLRRSAAWISLEAFELILASARELVPSDAAFMKACVFDINKVYGPMSLVLRSMTVGTTYRAMARTGHLVSKISHYEVIAGTRNSVTLRYHSKLPDSHLSCLSRQAQLATVASIRWGIPEAKVQVNARLCDGDDYCEYAVTWREPLKTRYPVAGGVLGLVLGYALVSANIGLGPFAPYLIAAIGVGTGLIVQMRRLLLDYFSVAEETSYEVEQVVQAHARAVDELLALHQREREWSHRIEARYHERRERLEQVVEAIEGRDDQKDDKLLNLSHDMNNPLTVLLAAADNLERSSALGTDEREMVQAINNSAERLHALLGEMATIVRGDARITMPVLEISVDELTNRVRRQLRATVLSRAIRVTVFQTREAPQQIQTDSILLERVVDNLLTNACKYTQRGSIVVEVTGTPGYLTLKISDTGRGISKDRLEQVFISGQPDKNPLMGTSHGDGLSIVVRILDQLCGRLEVMSTPDEGTTMWVSIPVSPPAPLDDSNPGGKDTPRGRFERVVKIRPRV